MIQEMPFLRLNRLRILRRGHVAYDQRFHEGINIIRGQNGSGKSTIADFIFYVLGGEYDDWKDAASRCDDVQAEIATSKGLLTLHRPIENRNSAISVYFGPMEKAASHSVEGWERFPIRRQQNRESFSQVAFRSIGIPEAQSDGASNITMHQLMRLCYSDQRTPATRLFRFESFDTQGIREAVGDLVCGISGYEIYENSLRIRDLSKKIEGIQARLSGLLRALPPDEALRSSQQIEGAVNDLVQEKERLLNEVSRVDELVNVGEVHEYLRERKASHERIAKSRARLASLETSVSTLEFEIREIAGFQQHLTDTLEKLSFAEKAFQTIGGINFTHCPACGAKLDDITSAGHCIVCNRPTDVEEEKSRYNRIRFDIEVQIRESKQLMAGKNVELENAMQTLREETKRHTVELSDFELEFSGANGPREAFLAVRTSRVGHIDAEIGYLTRSYGIASEIDSLNHSKIKVQTELEELKQRNEVLHRHANTRRKRALLEVSNIAASILRSDLSRQIEFMKAEKVELDFVNDLIAVDGMLNFAESSNVFLKNAAILAIFLAAGNDNAFFHPRFLLLDNIEDKGMEEMRSHLFQKIIVERATELSSPYQVIFTTSMMNPELELDDYTIGPSYTEKQRTLNL